MLKIKNCNLLQISKLIYQEVYANIILADCDFNHHVHNCLKVNHE